jgi:hypothetical protein
VQTFVVFIEFSASVRVWNARGPTTVVVVVVGFSVTIEQCFEVESWTTQYWSASAGIIDATSTAPQIIVFFMAPPGIGAVCPVENDFDPLEVPKNALTKNVRPKLVALVGCVKRHIGKNKASPLPGTLLWQSN